MAPEKILCLCCGKRVSRATELRHRQGKAPATLQASLAVQGVGQLATALKGNLRANPDLSARPRDVYPRIESAYNDETNLTNLETNEDDIEMLSTTGEAHMVDICDMP